jgi:hypothetical protein
MPSLHYFRHKQALNRTNDIPKSWIASSYEKQEGHDGPEIAHLYIGPWANANFKPGTFI